MSDTQILQYLNRNTSICGCFKDTQIHRTMTTTSTTDRFRYLKIIVLSVCSLFTLHTVQAQSGTVMSKGSKIIVQDNLLTGMVTNASGPMAGTNIILEGTKIGVTSDFNGKFIFPKALKEGDVLVFSYLGYKTQKITITKNQKPLKIMMVEDDIYLLGEVPVNRVYSSKGK
ncbi:hypothetical protein MHTCC0001_07620 [Flavobacteriaceae bacterium MHTCC 0001]